MSRLDQAIRNALQRAPHGRTAVELAEDLDADYPDVLAALKRLHVTGTAIASRNRAGAWTTGRP